MRSPAVAALAAAAVALVPRLGLACGGFFCAQSPVDQTAEQIVFAKEGDKAATYIQVSYTGAASAFAWIVPVLHVPEKLEVSELGLFVELQTLTAPRFLPPASAGGSSGGGGCACVDASAPLGSTVGVPPPEPKVIVLDEQTVGPFETATVESDSADDLLDWLQSRDFDVSDDARDLVQAYLDEGAKFVALKLTPTAGVQDIRPIKLTFAEWEPCVPLRLTRIAVADQLPMMIWILGESRALPTTFGHAEVALGKVRFDGSDPTTGTNWRRLVNEAADGLGGRAFVTEFAGPTSALLPGATGFRTRELLKSAPYLTRLFTVISPDEMTADPFFRVTTADEALPDVPNVHQLGPESLDATGAGAGAGAIGLSLLSAALLRRRRPRL